MKKRHQEVDSVQQHLISRNRGQVEEGNKPTVHTFETHLTPDEMKVLRQNAQRLSEETGEDQSMFT